MGYRNYSTDNGLIVDPSGNGDFKTIAAALAVVATGQTIFLRAGTYSESNTISTACNITAFTGDGQGNVKITGTITVTAAITVNISNIYLTTPATTYFLAVTGSAASVVNLTNCYLNCSVATGINYSSSSASSGINLYQCTGNLGTTGIGLYTMSSSGNLYFSNCYFNNTGASTTASSNSAGVVYWVCSVSNFPLSTSSTGVITTNSSIFNTSATNSVCITTAGTGSANGAICSSFVSGSASSLSLGSGTTTNVNLCSFSSSNTNVLTGAGTITFSGLTYLPTESYTNNVTTQTGGAIQGIRAGNAPSAGFLGEQIRSFVPFASAVSLSTNVAKNITSISLTPGIWDLSSNVGFSVASTTTVTALQSSMSTTSNTVTNNFNDDMAQWGATTGIAGFSSSLCVSGFRVTISTTTTYYLVALALFGVSTVTALGRISATRVG